VTANRLGQWMMSRNPAATPQRRGQ